MIPTEYLEFDRVIVRVVVVNVGKNTAYATAVFVPQPYTCMYTRYIAVCTCKII